MHSSDSEHLTALLQKPHLADMINVEVAYRRKLLSPTTLTRHEIRRYQKSMAPTYTKNRPAKGQGLRWLYLSVSRW